MNYVKITGSSRKRSRRSRGLRRRLAAAALVVVAIAFVAWGVARMRATAIAQPSANVVQAQRVAPNAYDVAPGPPPAPDWSASDIAHLQHRLQDAFAPALAGATHWSLAVLSADGKPLFQANARNAVVPASTAKLVVAATALDVLGASYRYHTVLAADGGVGGDGTLEGNLWLAGSGDPSLGGDDLRGGVATVAKAGLRRISGSAAVDPSAMRGPELNPHWDPDDAGEDYAAPTNALSIDGNTFESHKSVGGVEQRFWTPIHDVPHYASAMLEHALRQRGISTGGPPIVGTSPLETVVLWDHRSPPLRALEAHMLYFSDNHYAEQLLRTLGSESTGRSDDVGGLAAERQFLSEHGIPDPGLRLQDGSGLSGDDRIAAITLARILSDAQLRGGASTLYLLLPQGGKEGTLQDYDFTTALGRVRAKSGHISGVSALAGYVNTLHHGRAVFAFLVNGSPGDPDAAIVRAVDRLAEF